jgi:hypothetical protein
LHQIGGNLSHAEGAAKTNSQENQYHFKNQAQTHRQPGNPQERRS